MDLGQELNKALQQAVAAPEQGVGGDVDPAELAAKVEKEMAELHASGDAVKAPKQKQARKASDSEGPAILVPGNGEEPKTFLVLQSTQDDTFFIYDETFAKRGDMQLVEVMRGKDGQFQRVLKR